MVSSKYMIGVDIGTTSTKSVLFSIDGSVIANHGIEYPLYSPTPEIAEQDPEEIFQAVIHTIKEVVRSSNVQPVDILCVSCSSAMHSVIAVDEKGNPLTRCITWADNRSASWAEKIKNDMNGHEIYLRTGTPIHPMSPLSKLVWLKNEHAKRLGKDPYEVLTEIAAKVNPGSDGLLFHPYLAGERAPLWNANARGSFFGLGLHHKKEHLIRAVLEGIIYNLYTVLLALKELIGEPKKIQATGGFARSELWRQMMAYIFHQGVYVPESFESSCLGAAILGLYSLGEVDTLHVVSEMVGANFYHEPNMESVEKYKDLTPIYIRLSRHLEEEYESIAAFQKKWI
ncbi:hypothetical protein CN907_27110 [Bacillus anthracis]|nr:hypothetical protein CN907_27110 [Bacillus anthracis]